MRELRGLTALVTGASGGLGSYIADALAREGMHLVLTARSRTELEPLATRLRAHGSTTVIVTADLTHPEGLERLVQQGTATTAAIDVLVNNAGTACMLPYHRIAPADIRHEIELNLTAPMLLTRLLLPGMVERKRGHIVNISSLGGEVPLPYEEAYCATKAGLILFTKSLRAGYRSQGISASVILPGVIRGTGMVSNFERKSGLRMPRSASGGCTPEQVARAVVRAIRRDLLEVIVNRPPLRPLLAILRLFPGLADPLFRSLGVYKPQEAAATVNLQAGGAFTGARISGEPPPASPK